MLTCALIGVAMMIQTIGAIKHNKELDAITAKLNSEIEIEKLNNTKIRSAATQKNLKIRIWNSKRSMHLAPNTPNFYLKKSLTKLCQAKM